MGAVVIDTYGMTAGILFASSIFLMGCVPLWCTKVQSDHYRKDNFRSILHRIPKRSLLVIALIEFEWLAGVLFPLYAFVYIQSNLKFIGGFQVLIGLASMVAIYFYGKIMDKKKSDLLRFAALGLALTFVLKLNIVVPLLFISVALLEGLFSKFYRTSYVRDIYALGKDFNASEYQEFYLIFESVVNIVIVGTICLLQLDLVVVLYVCAFATAISGLLHFNDGRGGYK
jgi:hypothetical protein